MELDQLIPEKTSWKKTIQGESETREFTFNFRAFDLEDESWLKRTFGDSLREKLEQMDMDAITKIAFHQLEAESKRALMKVKFMDIDEDGNDVEVCTTGPAKFGKFVVGYPDQFELLKVLLKTRGLSMPIIEEIEGQLGNALTAQPNA